MALWTPAQIDTALWLDAADASTLTLDGSAVSEWRDKSGNATHLAQATSASRPTQATAVLNGLPAIQFNGTSHFLTGGNVLNIGAGDMQMFVVARQSAANKFTPYAKAVAAGVAGRYGVATESNILSAVATYTNTSAGVTSVAFSTTAAVLFAQRIIQALENQIWVNGSKSAHAAIPQYTYTTTWRFLLGAYNNSNDTGVYAYHGGDIHEVVFIRSRNDDHHRLIEGYLAHKWGLEADLPADHPYKLAAPTLKSISGTVTDDAGQPASRTVRVYDRATGALLDTITSDAVTGAYEFALSSTDEVQRIVLDDEGGTLYNDIIDRVIPG